MVLSLRWRLDTSVPGEYLAGIDNDGSTGCLSWEAGTVNFTAAIKLLPTEMDESAIMFMAGVFDFLDPIVVTEAAASLPKSMAFGALVFTGVESYNVFEGTDFSGTALCLEASPNVISKGYGINYIPKNITVGSVRLGCDGIEKLNSFRATASESTVILEKVNTRFSRLEI